MLVEFVCSFVCRLDVSIFMILVSAVSMYFVLQCGVNVCEETISSPRTAYHSQDLPIKHISSRLSLCTYKAPLSSWAWAPRMLTAASASRVNIGRRLTRRHSTPTGASSSPVPNTSTLQPANGSAAVAVRPSHCKATSISIQGQAQLLKHALYGRYVTRAALCELHCNPAQPSS
jgi:hypothetical protein